MIYAVFAAAGLLVGIVVMFILIAVIQARNDRHRMVRKRTSPGKPSDITETTDTQPKKKPIEFSKAVLGFVMLTYFVGLGFGIYAVNMILLDYPEYAIHALIAIFGYVGTPITTAIGFYSWKAKAENVVKISKENPKEMEGIPIDLSNIDP